jgi:hypothetical protein
MNIKIKIIILFLLNRSICLANPDTIPHLFTGFQAHYGFIIPHSQAIEPVSHTKPFGFEIDLNRINTSFRSWSVFNAYWISGVQAGYFNFQNPGVLGGAFVLTAFAEPVLSCGRNHIVSVRGGGGISYQTKIYDQVENPLNQFFCTRISFPLYVSVKFKYRLSAKTFITLSGNYNHISNGGIKQPNYGMNFPTVSMGIEYFPNSIPDLSRKFSSNLVVQKPGIFYLIQVLSCYKVLDKTDIYPEKAAFVFGLHARIAKQIRTYYALNAGAELILDGSIKETIKRENLPVDYKRFALTAGQDFLLGKMIFTQYLGFYIYSPYKAKNTVYQKYELACKVLPNLLLGVYLKAHTSDAELMGINVSCLLFRK